MIPEKKKYVRKKKKPVSGEDIRRFFAPKHKEGKGRKSREVKFMEAIHVELLGGKEIKVGRAGELWYRVKEGDDPDAWERYYWQEELNKINLKRQDKDKISKDQIINVLGRLCGMDHATAAKFAGYDGCTTHNSQQGQSWENIKNKGVKEVTRDILAGINIQPVDIIKPVAVIMQKDDTSDANILAASRNLQEITGIKEDRPIHIGNNLNTINIAEIMADPNPDRIRLAGHQVRGFLGLPGDMDVLEGIPTEEAKALPAPVDAEYVMEE